MHADSITAGAGTADAPFSVLQVKSRIEVLAALCLAGLSAPHWLIDNHLVSCPHGAEGQGALWGPFCKDTSQGLRIQPMNFGDTFSL